MKLSALVLAKNEEEMIGDCLKQLDFANEIIVLDQNSHDKTAQIAKDYSAIVIKSNSEDFAKNRDMLKNEAKGEWILYVDCDERFSKEGVLEIKSKILSGQNTAYYFPRKNYILGHLMKHGGWWPDYVPRLFLKSTLKGWTGNVHESPLFKGPAAYMENPIIHLTARNVSLMLSKSIKWAKVEACLRYKAGQSEVGVLKTIKAGLLEFFNRYVFKMAMLDGKVGMIESIYQGLHQAMVMVYLWELQHSSQNKRWDDLL